MTGSDLHITAESSRNLKGSLQELIDESGSLSTALLDLCGNRISACGEVLADDDGVIAALAVGAFAATRELASRLGDPVFDGLVHHGRERHFYLCNAGDDFLLLALFDHTTAAGVVRLCASRTASEIAALLGATMSPAPGLRAGAGAAAGVVDCTHAVGWGGGDSAVPAVGSNATGHAVIGPALTQPFQES